MAGVWYTCSYQLKILWHIIPDVGGYVGLIKKLKKRSKLEDLRLQLAMQRTTAQLMSTKLLRVGQALYQYAKGENWAREPGAVHPYWIGPKDYGWELAEETLELKFGKKAMQKFATLEEEEEKKRGELRKTANVSTGIKKDVPTVGSTDISKDTGTIDPVRDRSEGGV